MKNIKIVINYEKPVPDENPEKPLLVYHTILGKVGYFAKDNATGRYFFGGKETEVSIFNLKMIDLYMYDEDTQLYKLDWEDVYIISFFRFGQFMNKISELKIVK